MLSLDLAGVTGWAYGTLAEEVPLSGSWKLATMTEGARFSSLQNKLVAFCERWRPSIFAVEAPIVMRVMKGPVDANQQLGLRAIAALMAWRARARFVEVDCLTVRAEMLGSRSLPRDDAKAAALAYWRDRGRRVASHDEAEALLQWAWFRYRERGERPPLAMVPFPARWDYSGRNLPGLRRSRASIVRASDLRA